MNELKPFIPALEFINQKFDVPGVFDEDDLPAKDISELPYNSEEQVTYYILTLPSFSTLITANNEVWEPWLEPLSSFIKRYPDYQLTNIFDDRSLKERQQKLFEWVISLCDWEQYPNQVNSNNTFN